MSAIAEILTLLNQCGLSNGTLEEVHRCCYTIHSLILPRSFLVDLRVVLFIMFEDRVLRVDLFDVVCETERLQRHILVLMGHIEEHPQVQIQFNLGTFVKRSSLWDVAQQDRC